MSDPLCASDRTVADARREATLNSLLAHYGDGADGMAPTRAQWVRLLEGPLEAPITLINFFKLSAVANPVSGRSNGEAAGSGGEAIMRYAAVSGPALERVGGRFLLTAPFEGCLMGEGEDDDWDLVAIGSYPSRGALFDLFLAPDYVAAYADRRAALERQKVVAVQG